MRLGRCARVSSFVALSVGCATVAGRARAEDLSKIIPGFLEVTLYNQSAHADHFFRQDAAGNLIVDPAIAGLNAAIASQFATFPLGSSSGGFVYAFDPASGTNKPASATFGSLFSERALTLGKKKWNFGVRYLHSSADSIDGIKLSGGNVSFVLRHEDLGNPADYPFIPYYQGDVVQSNFDIRLTLDTAQFFGSYGVTDRFDLGIAIPMVQAKLDVTAAQAVQDLSGSGDHYFSPGPPAVTSQVVSNGDKASGLGDITLRGKYRFFDNKTYAMAAAVDLRLPTGDEKNFLGTGVTQAKLFFVGSAEFGKVAPHLNLGYTFSHGTNDTLPNGLPDEVDYAVGLDAAVHPRVTLTADLVGRTLLDAQRVRETPTNFPANTDPSGIPANEVIVNTIIPQLEAYTGNVNLFQGALGLKINPSKGLLIDLGAWIPISDSGLRNDVSAVAGLDYSF